MKKVWVEKCQKKIRAKYKVWKQNIRTKQKTKTLLGGLNIKMERTEERVSECEKRMMEQRKRQTAYLFLQEHVGI